MAEKQGYNTTDPLDFEAQEVALEENARIERFLTEQANDDLKNVMSTRSGRRFVWHLIDFTGMWRTAAGELLERSEGQRSVGLVLWGRLQDVCPDSLMEMQRENLYD